MALITNSAGLDFLAIVIVVSIGVVTFIKWRFQYWAKLNVPYIQPTIPFGTLGNLLWSANTLGVTVGHQYKEGKKKGYKHLGLFTLNLPLYMPIDLDIIKSIMSKDFNYFTDRGFYFNEKDDPLSAHLFSLEGEKWKSLRSKLTPTFTSGKMKIMFETQVDCAKQLVAALDYAIAKRKPVNIKNYSSSYTIDVIGACVFGINCNSFKNPGNDFQKHGKRIGVQTTCEMLKFFAAFSNPSVARSLGIGVFPKETTDFFMNIIKETVAFREKTNEIRKDFLQVLIELKNGAGYYEGGRENHLTIKELAAQSLLFFFAGYDTSSTTMSFALYELSENPDVQEQVREEINSFYDNHDGNITYENIKEMTYLNQVIEETLRKYPPLPMLNRKCVSNYKVPNCNLTIEKGTNVIIPLCGLHYDPEYFPNPEKFDPERFSSENKKNIIPFSYMPFGEGPRLCIGMRFGLMQTLIGLSLLLKNFKFSLNDKTKVPLQMSSLSIVLSVVGDIWLNVEKV
ncbi:hypothetical protein RN001_010600 [Aquatica leii]|uniref:Cytochrome P450 n=1 Tax=Aquatica leii TaxID=1421715 RepID=A0AAN7P6Q3_9COLE|nr:hypothetical protein RN001_010600 [Aquatica leii]